MRGESRRKMEILNSTTGEIVTLSLIDPKTGCSWVEDYMFNAIEKGSYEEPTEKQLEQFPHIVAVMDNENATWWQIQIENMQLADNTLYEKRQEVKETSEYGECSQFDEDFHQYICGYDFDCTPNAIIRFCESYDV